ncbi:MAG: hypothetical protein AAFX06_22675 [Planctomycetota bacterium]
MYRRFTCIVVCCIALFATTARAQFLPLPLRGLPNCATEHLYSIGDLHYYRTVDCSNTSVTGYGTSGDLLTEYGCVNGACNPNAVVDVTFQQLVRGERNILDVLFAQVNTQKCKLMCRQGRFGIPNKRSRAQFRRTKRQLLRIRDTDGDPRQPLADALVDPVSPSLFDDAFEALDSSVPAEAEFARELLDRIAIFQSSARSPTNQGDFDITAPNTEITASVAVEDRDIHIGIMQNEDEDEDEIPLNDPDLSDDVEEGLFRLVDQEESWVATDARCFRSGESEPTQYVNYSIVVDEDRTIRAVFRLQQVTNGTEFHYVGQQVRRTEVPDGGFVLRGDNVEIIQTSGHAHVLRVRTKPENEDDLDDTNSKDFVVYSGRPLFRRALGF